MFSYEPIIELFYQLLFTTGHPIIMIFFFFDDFCVLIVEIFVHGLLIWSFVIGANSFFKFDRLLEVICLTSLGY